MSGLRAGGDAGGAPAHADVARVRLFGPPRPMRGLVARSRLITRLQRRAEPSLSVLSAPAGYGKTTLLAQWAAADPRPFAWVNVGLGHADPGVFLADVVAAIEEIEPLADRGLGGLLRGSRSTLSAGLIPRLGRCLRALRAPLVLVLDDGGGLRDPLCFEAVEVMAATLPEGCQLALAARSDLPLRLGAARAGRRLVELGPQDLAMGAVEADLLLGELGVRVGADDLELLLGRTEGWPAGLVLAALAIRDEPDRRGALERFAGSDRRVADYFAEEVLQHASESEVSLLMRTSVLDTLAPASCSAVLGRQVTLEELRRVSGESRFVVPLDQQGERYRLHHLLADMLRAELRRREPAMVPVLHARAAAWHESQGDPLTALRHLRAAGDDDEAGRLVWRSVPRLQPTGRLATLRQMLACFTAEEIAARAPLALAMAWTCADQGSHMMSHWLRAAEAVDHEGPLPGGPATVRSAIALLHATLGADGVAQIGRDAASAYDLDADDSPWRSVCCLMMGVAAHLTGDEDEARRRLREGAERAGAMIPSVFMLCESWLAVMRALAGDRAGTRLHAARGEEQVEAAGLREYASYALLESVLALEAAQAGEDERSRERARHARLLMDNNANVAPWLGIGGRILLARAAMLTGDGESARTLAREAVERGRRVADAPVLEDELQSLQRAIDGVSAGALSGPGSLTTAELRVLQFLPTHLTFREIGEHMHLSRFTIKSQALSVYRKLGVGSRSEAVERARGLGLLTV